MTTPTHILDGRGTSQRACVTSIGQLITAPFAYDETEFREMALADTAFNFYQPESGKQFVITGIRTKASRFVSNTVDAEFIVYEASSENTLSVDKILYEDAFIRGEGATLRVNIVVNEGKYINAKTDDATFFTNIFGYYIPKLGD